MRGPIRFVLGTRSPAGSAAVLQSHREWLVRCALPQTAADGEVPCSDGSCDRHAAGRAKASAHVRDWKGEEVVADPERGELLLVRCGLAPGRRVHARREHDEIRAEAEIGPELRVGEAADGARRPRARAVRLDPPHVYAVPKSKVSLDETGMTMKTGVANSEIVSSIGDLIRYCTY